MSGLTEIELSARDAGDQVKDRYGNVWTRKYVTISQGTLDPGMRWTLESAGWKTNSYSLIKEYGPISDVKDEKPVKEEKTFYVDPVTGGRKETKLAKLGAIDPTSLLELAKVAGHGAGKYETFNYLKGYPWSLNFDSAQRHILAFWSGENIDPESNLPHLAHAAWHCLALLSFMNHNLGTDDRWVPPQS